MGSSRRGRTPMRTPQVTTARSAILALVVAVGLVVGFGGAASAAQAAACSCAGMSDQQAFATADAVFAATLVEAPDDAAGEGSPTQLEPYVFEVTRVYKGTVTQRQTVVVPSGDAGCGLELSGAGPFLVFAQRADKSLGAEHGSCSAGLCSGTRSILDVRVPTAFGVGYPPVAGVSTSRTPPSAPGSDGFPTTVIVGAVLVIALAAGSAGALRSRRRGVVA